MKHIRFFIAASALCAAPLQGQSACDAVVGNPVLNCGFETGNLNDWTIVPNIGVSYEVTAAAARTGNYGLRVGPTTGVLVWNYLTWLYPEFNDEDHWAYDYEVWFRKSATGGLAYLGDPLGMSLQANDNVWHKRTGTLYRASSLDYGADFLRIGVSSDEVSVYLDDFVITGKTRIAVAPEPSTYALLLMGLAIIGFAARQRVRA